MFVSFFFFKEGGKLKLIEANEIDKSLILSVETLTIRLWKYEMLTFQQISNFKIPNDQNFVDCKWRPNSNSMFVTLLANGDCCLWNTSFPNTYSCYFKRNFLLDELFFGIHWNQNVSV